MSNVVEKVKAKIDNVLHKDDTTTHNTAGTHHHQHHNTTDQYAVGGTSASTNAGPHSSNVANKLDPRVDSDRDNSHNLGAANYGPGGATNPNTTGGAHGGAYTQGTHAGTGNGYNTSTNAGPHSSNIANKLDPRVDSDRDNSHNLGAANYGPGGATNPNTTGGVHGGAYTHGTTGVGNGNGYNTSTNAGPHSSNIANKLDPRVDSDRDNSHNLGAANYGPGGATNPNTTGGVHGGAYTHGTTGVGNGNGYNTSTNAGPHSSNVLNSLDPRVDSDNDGSRNFGLAKTGEGATYNASTGPATGTAGPHGSNLLNKLDPRVDSDASNNNIHGGVGAHTTAHTHHHNNPNTTF
jgi:hypothetical protein